MDEDLQSDIKNRVLKQSVKKRALKLAIETGNLDEVKDLLIVAI